MHDQLNITDDKPRVIAVTVHSVSKPSMFLGASVFRLFPKCAELANGAMPS